MVEFLCQLHLIIHGSVQGVSFRWFVQQEAQKLGVVGSVQNRRDGMVEVVGQGTKAQLEKLKELCQRGPVGAQVAKVEEVWQNNTERTFTDFTITYYE